MAGIDKISKKNGPNLKKPAEVIKWTSGLSSLKERNQIWKDVVNPLPYDGETPKQEGPVVTTGTMSAEDVETVKRRRRKPATVLSATSESDSLGG